MAGDGAGIKAGAAADCVRSGEGTGAGATCTGTGAGAAAGGGVLGLLREGAGLASGAGTTLLMTLSTRERKGEVTTGQWSKIRHLKHCHRITFFFEEQNSLPSERRGTAVEPGCKAPAAGAEAPFLPSPAGRSLQEQGAAPELRQLQTRAQTLYLPQASPVSPRSPFKIHCLSVCTKAGIVLGTLHVSPHPVLTTISKKLPRSHFIDEETGLEKGMGVHGWQALNQGLSDSKFFIF